MSLISNPLYVLGMLCLVVVVSEKLVERTFFRHVGTALMVILLTAVLANIRILPTASDASPLYDIIFSYLAPISIFFLLLSVNLKDLKKAGAPMLYMFLIGSVGTTLGVIVAINLINGPSAFGELYAPLAGMFTGTYTGGSINFNAIALHYRVMEEGVLFAGAVAVDNIMTAVWMVMTLLLPRILTGMFGIRHLPERQAADLVEHSPHDDEEKLNPKDLGLMLGLGLVTLLVSNLLSVWLAARGLAVPSILILTSIALVLAQFPFVQKLRGNQVLGMFSVYLFLAVVGAYCELASLVEIGRVGFMLLMFAGILIAVHGLITFLSGRLLRQDWQLVAVASQANIGGSTSALALSKSFARNDLMLPAILVGSLGNGMGTYLGFLVAGIV